MKPAWPRTALGERLGVALPIVQAPMARVSMAELAAAVCEAGGLGSLGTAVLTPAEVEAEVRALRQRTSRPFALNFFCHSAPRLDEARLAAMRARLAPYREELGAGEATPLAAPPPAFGPEMLELVLSLRPAVVSFHFGLPDAGAVGALRAAGVLVISTATTVTEARLLEERGADAVIAQGIEAGGHRGVFASPAADGQVGTMALVPQIAAAVKLPVIAAGGIADGRGVAAALALGASAAQLGTAFLGCPEARLDPLYRQALAGPAAGRTRVTTLLSGRPARAIVNRLLEELAGDEDRTLDFPLQRQLVAPLAAAAAERGRTDFHSMWAGQAAPLIRWMPAGELVALLARETSAILG